MATLGFVMTSSNQPLSGEVTLQSIRRFYPDAYCMILGVGDTDYFWLSKKFKTDYLQPHKRLGYPKEPFGWRKDGVLEFLEKIYIACIRTNTTHLMYVEEDIQVLKPVTLFDDIEIAGYRTAWPDGSKFPKGFPDEFIRIIEEFSGATPNIIGYGAGGGTIFKVSTFIKNYDKVKAFILANLDYIQDNVYPTAGWIDCFMTWYFLLCGKQYTFTPVLKEVGNDFDPKNVPDWVEVASGCKILYTDNFMEMRND